MPEETPAHAVKDESGPILGRADVALGLALAGILCSGAMLVFVLKGLSNPMGGSAFDIAGIAALLFAVLALFASSRRMIPEDLPGLSRVRISRILAVLVLFSPVAWVSLPGMLEAPTARRVSRTRSNLRSLATAIEAYRTDQGSYPAAAIGAESVNGARFSHSALRTLPSFRLAPDVTKLQTLTTPVSYLAAYPADPYAAESGATFIYWTAKKGGADGWILVSAGPDRDYDLDPVAVYDPAVKQPSPDLLHFTYDPTNGTVSGGDLWRVKQ